jgi:hypothetical protein
MYSRQREPKSSHASSVSKLRLSIDRNNVRARWRALGTKQKPSSLPTRSLRYTRFISRGRRYLGRGGAAMGNSVQVPRSARPSRGGLVEVTLHPCDDLGVSRTSPP